MQEHGPASSQSDTGDIGTAIKRCRECALAIPSAAKVCTHCNNNQDWRRFFHLSQVTLALLIALVSVITALIPAIKTFTNDAAKISYSSLAFDGRSISFVAANRGDRPAVFDRGIVFSKNLGETIGFRLDDKKEALIGRGAKLLVGHLNLVVTEKEAKAWLDKVDSVPDLERFVKPEVLKLSTSLPDGSIQDDTLEIEPILFFQAISDQYDYCRDLRESGQMARSCGAKFERRNR